jgi:hypothetical protein
VGVLLLLVKKQAEKLHIQDIDRNAGTLKKLGRGVMFRKWTETVLSTIGRVIGFGSYENRK